MCGAVTGTPHILLLVGVLCKAPATLAMVALDLESVVGCAAYLFESWFVKVGFEFGSNLVSKLTLKLVLGVGYEVGLEVGLEAGLKVSWKLFGRWFGHWFGC